MKWIKSSDELPENGVQVLVLMKFNTLEVLQRLPHPSKKNEVCWFKGSSQDRFGYSDELVVYWMSLPSKPKDDNETT